ncbi:MAG: antibiotic biosynthesis monooxygenase [Betaproteobacteria bacterium]|nr:antibiotic biosynthesis monooxygenase [Betaproteobacteria bacterium]
MVEVTQTFDLVPGIDQRAWGELAHRAVATVLRSPGIVEFRAHRNQLGSPKVRTTAVWQSLADWAKAAENPEIKALETEMGGYVTNLRVEFWVPSPVLPDAARPR